MPSIDLEGRAIPLEPGDTIASAVFRAGVRVFGRSLKKRRPRGLYCLSGDCPNCLVTVDGEPGVRACVTEARTGQRVARGRGWPSAERDLLAPLGLLAGRLPAGFYYRTPVRPAFLWPLLEPLVRRLAAPGRPTAGAAGSEPPVRHHHPDLLVVGGGVAGLAAAVEATRAGESVLLCDEGAVGIKLPPGPARERALTLAAELRALPGAVLLEGAAAIGVYEGPLVPVSAPDLLHLVHPGRVVVATGAVERHAVFSGNDLAGVWLGRGAARLTGVHGLAPARAAVVVVSSPEGLEHVETLRAAGVEIRAVLAPGALAASVPAEIRALADGEVVQASGRGRLARVEVAHPGGRETIACDGLVLSTGLVPRDSLLRQAEGLPVAGAGDAVLPGCSLEGATESGRAAAPGGAGAPAAADPGPPVAAGCVCLCEDVDVRELEAAWQDGFRSTELLKRFTTVAMGPCRGALCQGPLRAFASARGAGDAAAAPTTARPPVRPLRVAEAAAAARHDEVVLRTALHERHLALGARMERLGAWLRPESYGDPLAEYWAVRRGVGIFDGGTLGKLEVGGRDAAAFLERLYPCRVEGLETGRLRYTLLLNEAGYVLDDGLVAALGSARYYLTFTSGGAERAEAWLRDWADAWDLDVHVANRTHAVGVISVAGPRSRELLARLTGAPLDGESLPYLAHRELHVAGVPCRALRLGFVGELSYELHHPSSRSGELWEALLAAGDDLGVVPHGLEAVRVLRLEKGHILVGQDTDFDATPAKLGLEALVAHGKGPFVGSAALERLAPLPLERRLAGVVFSGVESPPEGAPLTAGGRHVGHLTSARYSPALERPVALAWLRRDGEDFPEEVDCLGARGRVSPTPFYDQAGERVRG